MRRRTLLILFAAPWIEKTCTRCGARRSLYTSSWDLGTSVCFRCRRIRQNSRQLLRETGLAARPHKKIKTNERAIS